VLVDLHSNIVVSESEVCLNLEMLVVINVMWNIVEIVEL
jgi:hypothetical protein